MNGKEKKSPARQFHSLDGLDTIGDLMSESKTVTAVVSKGRSRDKALSPLLFLKVGHVTRLCHRCCF